MLDTLVYILAVLIGMILLYLAAIIFLPVLKVRKQALPAHPKHGFREEIGKHRIKVSFRVGGERVIGFLYVPQAPKPVPCIVMSHGLGGTKDMLLENYAKHFVDAGLACLTYDYRHFGESEGEPRQLFSLEQQLEDLKAAVAYARSREEVNPAKIFLWGTSAAGGYGIQLASIDMRIAGVIAQCPALNFEEDSKALIKREGIRYFFKLIPHAQRDMGRSRFGLSPHRVPIVGKPHTTAFLTVPGAFEGYSNLASSDFKNEICMRMLLEPYKKYNPIKAAEYVKCPVLMQICKNDNMVSQKSHFKVAQRLKEKAKVITYPIGHFDIYNGEPFKQALQDQLDFILSLC